MIVSVCAGIQIGSWLNYQLGYMIPNDFPPPYPIIWPSNNMLGLTILRTIIGFCGVMSTKAIAKSMSYGVVCAFLGRDKNELLNSENTLENKHKIFVELCYKYFACAIIGFNAVYLFPNAFKLVGIERPTFYTEI
jgi:sphingosine-1-phosphate phosphatase 1